MQSFSMSCDSSISHSCFHKHVRLQYFVHNLNYKIQSKKPCHQLQAAIPKLNSGYYRLHFVAASTNPWNSGCGLLGLDFSSGCACVAMNQG